MATLLNSQVTIDDVNHTIEEQLHTKLDPNSDIKPIGALGLQSVLGLVNPKWEAEDKSKLPKTFVLKIASPDGMLKAFAEDIAVVPPEVADLFKQGVENFTSFLIPAHNTEIKFYELVAKHDLKIPIVPKYYFGVPFDSEGKKAYLGLEDLTQYKVFPPVVNFNEAQIHQALSALARLQAKMMNLPEADRDTFPHKNLTGLYACMPDWTLQLQNGMVEKIPHPALPALTKKFAEILPNIIKSEEVDNLPEKLGFEKVFVHGDFWPANLMWDMFDGGCQLARIIDFQMSYFGVAVTDIARILNTSLDVETRRNHWKDYLKFYHEAFQKALEDGQKMPFTLEQLERTYQLVYPRISAYLLPAFLAVLKNVMKLPDSPQKAEAMGNVLGKFVAVYEDIITMHELAKDV